MQGGLDIKTWTVDWPERNAPSRMEVHLCVSSYQFPKLVSQISSLGLCVGHYNANKEWRELFRYEARILSLFPSFCQSKDTSVIDNLQCLPATQVAEELRTLFAKIYDKGWMIQLYVADAGREFRLFSNLFTSQGLYRHAERFDQPSTDSTGLFQNLILGNVCPLGQGRSVTVIDLNQRIRGWCDLLGIPVVEFRIPYQRIFQQRYSGLRIHLAELASEQVTLWQALVQAMNDYVDLKKQLDNALAIDVNSESFQFTLSCYICARDQLIQLLTPID